MADSCVFERRLAATQVEEMLSVSTHYRCIAGHRVSCDLPYDNNKYDVRSICFVRDPVDRFVSEFYYLKKIGRDSKIGGAKTIEEFVDMVCVNPSRFSWALDPQAACTMLDFEQVDLLLRQRKLMVLPSEKFNDAMLLLNHIYPTSFKDVSYMSRNVNSKRPRALDPVLAEKIRSMNPKDTNLWGAAISFVEELIADCGCDFDQGILSKRRRMSIFSWIRGRFLEKGLELCGAIGVKMKYLKLPM